MKHRLQSILQNAIREAAHQASWSGLEDFVAEIERPKQRGHGDYATNAALILAQKVGEKPRFVAEWIRKCLQDPEEIVEKTEVAGPGFLNFKLKTSAWQRSLRDIEAPHFARPNLGQGERLLIEYVSANPTGPLHIGNARGGPLGDSLARLLAQCGYDVTTEYYVNDIGGQVERLGHSILHWIKVEKGVPSELPEGGYFGPYVQELAREALAHPEKDYLNEAEAEAVSDLARWGLKRLTDEIRSDCEAMGSSFDRWVSERELRHDVDDLLRRLIECNAAAEREGALWFIPPSAAEKEDASTIESRESVLRRQSGEPTYFADDIVCHEKRFRDGFNRIINIWGANHHGHVPRIKAAMEVLGYDAAKVEVILYQYVRVCRGDEVVKMSKRAGDYVTAREVLEEVGPDAMRFFLLQRASSAHLDFDLELAKKESTENPIYYIQYSHARICSIERKGAARGLTDIDFEDIDPALLNLPEETEIIQLLFEYPEIVEKAARERAPHHIAFYLLDAARSFHSYYTKAKADDRFRVLSDDIDRSQAKLYLLRVIKSVLADGLQILNLTAPEEMRSPPEEAEG